jgi:serine phosphatase RsbU (regulator of sigma subunit)
MLADLLAERLAGRRLAALVTAGVALELIVVLISRHVGSSGLIGIHGVIAIAIAIAVAIAGGPMAGAIVGGIGAVLFVVLIAHEQPHDPHLEGVPIVVLWCALPIGAGAAADSLRRTAGGARRIAIDAATRAQALQRAVGRLAAATTPDEVARIAVVEGAAALGAQGAWLALVDDRRAVLDYVASSGFTEDMVEQFLAIALDRQIAATDVVRDGQARFFDDAAAMSAAYPSSAAGYRAVELEATAVLPLIQGMQTVGMIAFHWRDPHRFTPAERDIALTFGNAAGQALERARLYAEVSGTAAALQRSLLPAFLPTFPEYEIAVRYRPAFETLAVGGDWYDVVAAHRGQIGIAVGDVGGKGIEAAAIMGRLRTAMRAYAIEHAAPSDVLRRLVDYHALTRPDVFATVLYAALDRRQRQLRVASLGHPMPLLIRAGGAVELPNRSEAPLGAEADRSFHELDVPVEAGDLLIFVTDGVFERPGSGWDESLAQLASYAAADADVPVEELADRLIGSINDDASARDDRALVVIRVPDRTETDEAMADEAPWTEDPATIS